MFKTDKDLKKLEAQLAPEDERLEQQRQILVDARLTPDQLEAAMAPLICFRDQLAEEIEFYKRVKAKDLRVVHLRVDRATAHRAPDRVRQVTAGSRGLAPLVAIIASGPRGR